MIFPALSAWLAQPISKDISEGLARHTIILLRLWIDNYSRQLSASLVYSNSIAIFTFSRRA